MRSSPNVLVGMLRRLDDPRHFGRHLALLTGFAFLIRFGVLAFLWHGWNWQVGVVPDAWNDLAINLYDHGTFGFSPDVSTVVRGPIFPILEIPLYAVFGRNYAAWSICLMLLDTFTCVLLALTVRRLWGNRAGLLAGLYYSINLPIIFYTAKISQVTSMLPLMVLWLYLFCRWEKEYASKWLPWVLGLVSGLMILNKTVFLPVPFLCTALLFWLKRAEIRSLARLMPMVIYLVVTVAVVAPWTARNYVVTNGKFIPVQGYFWELFVQDVLYHDLDAAKGNDRAEGELLTYFKSQEADIMRAHGVSPDRPENLTGPQWEIMVEKAFKEQSLQWTRENPGKILRIKIGNLWHFWLRAENWSKTRTLILMQVVYLGAAILGFVLLWRARALDRVKYGLILIAVLWGEHCLVFAWGRFSLDLVPVLGLIFALGVDAWVRGSEPPTESAVVR